MKRRPGRPLAMIVLLAASVNSGAARAQTPDLEYVPPTVSPQAQSLLKTTKPVAFEGELTVEVVREVRRNWDAHTKPLVAMVREELVETVEEETIADVRVLIITPKGYNKANDDTIAVYLHGGGWMIGSPEGMLHLAAPLGHALGIRVYAVDYRLIPEHPFPAGLDDCFVVYRTLLKRFSPKNIVVFGDSAGGNLTLTTVLKARQENVPQPAAVALLSPVVDLTCVSETIHTLDGIDPLLAKDSVVKAFALYASGHNPKDPLLSPAYADFSEDFPPTLISTGTRDLLLSECARLHRKLSRAGVEVRLNVREGMWHTFEGFPIPEARESFEEIAAFFGAKLK